jgi:hypothetical protein
MIHIVEDNLGDPRVLRVKSTTVKIEVFVRQTRSGLVIRPERMFPMPKDKVLEVAQKYLDEHPKERGTLPYFLDSSITA